MELSKMSSSKPCDRVEKRPIKGLYLNTTFVLLSMGDWELPEWSPCRTEERRYSTLWKDELIWPLCCTRTLSSRYCNLSNHSLFTSFSADYVNHAFQNFVVKETAAAKANGKIPIIVKRPREKITLQGLPPSKFGPLELAVSAEFIPQCLQGGANMWKCTELNRVVACRLIGNNEC